MILEVVKTVGAVVGILLTAALMTYLSQQINRKDNNE